MFPVSNEALDLFSKNYRQTAEIIFYGIDHTFTITESEKSKTYLLLENMLLSFITTEDMCVNIVEKDLQKIILLFPNTIGLHYD